VSQTHLQITFHITRGVHHARTRAFESHPNRTDRSSREISPGGSSSTARHRARLLARAVAHSPRTRARIDAERVTYLSSDSLRLEFEVEVRRCVGNRRARAALCGIAPRAVAVAVAADRSIDIDIDIDIDRDRTPDRSIRRIDGSRTNLTRQSPSWMRWFGHMATPARARACVCLSISRDVWVPSMRRIDGGWM